MISALYAATARRRREWYAARPDARRRLACPVVSIGNLAAGGRGKTPCAAFVARTLLALGERPAILSRGYARTSRDDGAVVVRDPSGIRADVARAGDEPFMLARQLPGVIVVSSPDRYVGGRLAEHHFDATVHVLDDGFQHFAVDRDVDIVLVTPDDLEGSTFPGGRLREPPDVLLAADAILTLADADASQEAVGLAAPLRRLNQSAAWFRAIRRTSPAVFESLDGGSPPARIFAVAGTANPASFFSSAEALGFTVAGTRAFRDHHPFSARDVSQIAGAARAAGAHAILTTEKDYVRLLPFRPFAVPVGFVPLTMDVEPLDEFRHWLAASIADARDIVVG